MLKILFLILGLFLLSPAEAQQANLNYLGTTSTAVVSPSNSTLTSTTGIAGAFTNIATGQTGRQSCWLQFKPTTAVPVPAATNQGSVFFGITAPTTLTSSFVLNAYGIINCEQANEVEGSGIWVSSPNTGDVFTIKVK